MITVSYYNKCIPNFSDIDWPLNKLKRKGIQFKWRNKHQESFKIFKKSIISPPVLHLPGYNKLFILSWDVSKNSVASVLEQYFTNQPVPLGFYSRTLKKNEFAYVVFKITFLSCFWGCEKFKVILEDYPFTSCTKCLFTYIMIITYIMKSDKLTGQLARWRLRPS